MEYIFWCVRRCNIKFSGKVYIELSKIAITGNNNMMNLVEFVQAADIKQSVIGMGMSPSQVDRFTLNPWLIYVDNLA